jgi:hypothetical protein
VEWFPIEERVVVAGSIQSVPAMATRYTGQEDQVKPERSGQARSIFRDLPERSFQKEKL